jgi:hypothetical protein
MSKYRRHIEGNNNYSMNISSHFFKGEMSQLHRCYILLIAIILTRVIDRPGICACSRSSIDVFIYNKFRRLFSQKQAHWDGAIPREITEGPR